MWVFEGMYRTASYASYVLWSAPSSIIKVGLTPSTGAGLPYGIRRIAMGCGRSAMDGSVPPHRGAPVNPSEFPIATAYSRSPDVHRARPRPEGREQEAEEVGWVPRTAGAGGVRVEDDGQERGGSEGAHVREIGGMGGGWG